MDLLNAQCIWICDGILRMHSELVSGLLQAGLAADKQRHRHVRWPPGISQGFQRDFHADPSRITECDYEALLSVMAFDG